MFIRPASASAAPARVRQAMASAAPASTVGPRPRRVLLTNDDGPASPFFEPLVRQVASTLRWDCVVAIPSREFSFCSKLVSRGPIECARIHDSQLQRALIDAQSEGDPSGGSAPSTCLHGEYHFTASPGTAVNIALHSSIGEECDLVVSGPNVGHNTGRSSVLSSGTVGAALESAIAGRRAVAISFPFFDGWNKWTDAQIEDAVSIAGDVLLELWSNWDADMADVYNVNIPLGIRDDKADEDARSLIRRTFIDEATDYESLFKRADTNSADNTNDGGNGSGEGDAAKSSGDRSIEVYEWGPRALRAFESRCITEGSDVWAVRRKLVSVTPLHANLQSLVRPSSPPPV